MHMHTYMGMCPNLAEGLVLIPPREPKKEYTLRIKFGIGSPNPFTANLALFKGAL